MTYTASFLWRNEDYVTENTSSKWRNKNFPFSSPSLSKILVALLISCHKCRRHGVRGAFSPI